MKLDQIQKLLSLGEGQRIEFKSGIRNPDVLGRIVCSFLNSDAGGYLICGVSDPATITGIDASADLLADLEKILHDGLSPKALVSFEPQLIDGKQVLVIEVPAGRDGPYSYQDVIYVRVGDATRVADAATIRDIVMRKQVEPERWERRFSVADLDTDLDAAAVTSAVADAQRAQRAPLKALSRSPQRAGAACRPALARTTPSLCYRSPPPNHL